MEKPAALRVRIEVVEPMGNETYVYFSAGRIKTNSVARLNTSEVMTVGKGADFAVDMAKGHFFDPDSEKVIE